MLRIRKHMIASIVDRIKKDFFSKSYMNEYSEIIHCFKDHGYQMVSVYEFFRLIESGQLKDKKVFVNRHDVDNSPKNANRMFEIENEIYKGEGHSTFYFRLSTIDLKIMKRFFYNNFEIGYHYEEIADYAKKNKIRRREEIIEALPCIRRIFLDNLMRFKISTGIVIRTCASHGDFVNRILNIANTEILEDKETRLQGGIIAEAYDRLIENSVDIRLTDAMPIDELVNIINKSIDSETKVIMVLTHPGHWRVDYLRNLRKDFVRVYQALSYRYL